MDTNLELSNNFPYNLDMKLNNTHKHLINALYRLVEKYPFDTLSVKQICDEASVSRSNFYNHFNDKYHLLLFYLNLIYHNLKNKLTFNNNRLIIDDFLLYIQDHGLFFKSLFSYENGTELSKLLENVVTEDITSFFKDRSQKDDLEDNLLTQLQIVFLTGALTNTIQWWVCHDFPVSIAEISQGLDDLIKPDVLNPPKKD